MSALNAMRSVVGALAALPVFAGDDADAVTAGAATARVAASAATTTVRRVDRITILLVGVSGCSTMTVVRCEAAQCRTDPPLIRNT
jgi:hypothetical protein